MLDEYFAGKEQSRALERQKAIYKRIDAMVGMRQHETTNERVEVRALAR